MVSGYALKETISRIIKCGSNSKPLLRNCNARQKSATHKDNCNAFSAELQRRDFSYQYLRSFSTRGCLTKRQPQKIFARLYERDGQKRIIYVWKQIKRK